MHQAAFEKSLAVGHAGEKRVFDVLAAAGWNPIMENRGHKRDILVTTPYSAPAQERIEVKNEDRFADKQNACFELYQRGDKPSGLLASEATIFVHTFGEKALIYRKVPFLAWMLARIGDSKSKVVPFGDNGNQGVLESQLLVGMQWFGDYLELKDLPQSKVFRV